MSIIESQRLLLTPMTLLILEALRREDRATAGELLGCRILLDMSLTEMPLGRRLKQLQDDPTVQPWLLRAIVERESGTMIGRIGFHSPPRPDDLAEVAPDGIEIGYSIDPQFRRKGFATEAAIALMYWAYSNHDQGCFVLSISPDNLASTAMANRLGFIKCGSQMDDEDGLEHYFVRRFADWPMEWRV